MVEVSRLWPLGKEPNNMPEYVNCEQYVNECQCASCSVVRTAVAHGTLQRPGVGSTDWMDALGEEAARIVTRAGNDLAADPRNPYLRGKVNGVYSLYWIIKRAQESASIDTISNPCKE